MRNSEECGGCQMACQPAAHKKFSRLSRPHPVVALERAWWRIGETGLRATVRHALAGLRRLLASKKRPPARAGVIEALGLQPGDWAEVKSHFEICQTLDDRCATRGLKFLAGMAPFCGRRFRVHKRLETLFFEESRQIRKMKNTVLLEGVYCDGSTYHCDRSCFYYWREAWLRKVECPGSGELKTLVEEVRS